MGHGAWWGEWLERQELRPSGLDLAERQNEHVQHLVCAGDGDGSGVGILEQFVLGPYAPAGFGEL